MIVVTDKCKLYSEFSLGGGGARTTWAEVCDALAVKSGRPLTRKLSSRLRGLANSLYIC
jgi:hypothetical protein